MALKLCNFEITDKCNFKCDFCLKEFRRDLVGNISKKDLDKILELDPEAFVITGGEPSLNREAIFYFINKTSKPVVLNTNLSNFTPAEIIELNKRVIFHVDFPSIIKNEYINITKTSSKVYNKVTNNLKYISLNSSIVIVLTPKNIDNIFYNIKMLACEFGFKEFWITPALGKEIRNKSIEIFNKLDSFAKYNRTLSIKTLSYTKSFEQAKCRYINATHRCTAGLDRFVIKANGEIVNCAWSSEKVIGKIGDNLETILLNGKSTYKCNKYCLGEIDF